MKAHRPIMALNKFSAKNNDRKQKSDGLYQNQYHCTFITHEQFEIRNFQSQKWVSMILTHLVDNYSLVILKSRIFLFLKNVIYFINDYKNKAEINFFEIQSDRLIELCYF